MNELITLTLGLVALAVGCAAINWLAKAVLLQGVKFVIKRTSTQWDDLLVQHHVFTRLSHLAPAAGIWWFAPPLLGNSETVLHWVGNFTGAYLVAITLGVVHSILDAAEDGLSKCHGLPIRGLVQASKLVTLLVAGIFIAAVILDKSVMGLFAGLGAMTAVFMFVFRDAILGLIAGIQLSINKLAMPGDWVIMKSAGANGHVVDVSLTTLKVRNWDQTIVAIPTYDMISKSFENMREIMADGFRRFNRSIKFDIRSVRLADSHDLAKWSANGILGEWINRKKAEINAANAGCPRPDIQRNCRAISNIGAFRAYALHYLRRHKFITQKLPVKVRQGSMNENGLPMEICAFVNQKDGFEGVRDDIFDHLITMAPFFGLRIHQNPGAEIFKGLTK